MTLQQMEDFTFKHSAQQDAIYTQYTAQQIKALFDSRGDELRTALNLLITALSSTEGAGDIGTSTIQDIDGANIQAMLQSLRDKLKSKADGSSGADFVNATAIQGIAGETVQTILESLKAYIDQIDTALDNEISQTKATLETEITGIKASTISADPIAVNSGTTVQAQLAWLLSQIAVAATGSIPDGSLTEAKLAQALVDKINAALSNTGVLTTLLTFDQSSTTNAINETLTIPTAGGTATAITLSLPTLANGYIKTFIVSANNSGAATTINGKPLYKPNTTTTPNLIAGKAYTVWYNQASDCFFIKASAEGTATVDKVLAGETFSNDSDTGISGTMPNNGSLGTITPGTNSKTIPSGYTSGGTVVGDANLIPANIVSGKSIFGVAGSVIAGKRYASGSGTSDSSSWANITGLAFTPSVVIWEYQDPNTNYIYKRMYAFNSKGSGFSGKNSVNNALSSMLLSWDDSGGNMSPSYESGSYNTTFNASGAKMFLGSANRAYNWYAYE